MENQKSHPRWARATNDHVSRARNLLLDYIQHSGRPLPGGVTAEQVRLLPYYDLLDLAQMMMEHGDIGLAPILESARTQTNSRSDDST